MMVLRTEEFRASKLTHEKLVKQIGAAWLDALENFGYSVSVIRPHLLNRFCCLLATVNNEPNLSVGILSRLLGGKSRAVVTDVSFKFGKLPVGNITKLSDSATLGAHTRTSKFWARKHGGLATAAFQIMPISESSLRYANVSISADLVQFLSRGLVVDLAPEARAALRLVFPRIEDLVRLILVRVILAEPKASVVQKLEKLNTVWVPRPADPLSAQLMGALNIRAKVVRFGHNLAYTDVLRDEQSHRYFPFLEPVRPNALTYLDDIRAYRRPENLHSPASLKKKPPNLILVTCFPFGDTGYSEYYASDGYQRKFLAGFVEALTNSSCRDQVVFCIHPGTSDLEYVRATLGVSHRYVIGEFDRLLPEARLVIASYRGTTCVATALANRKRLVIVGEYELENIYAARGAAVVSLEQIMADIDSVINSERFR